ncbi:hypothetical protein M5689_013767 [Euphorbia peplus]|nr:hypothetical protein M5689_013767 [Euphorbia peplus]
MEAVWKVEEKCKITTDKAVLLFACIAFAVIGLCTAIFLKRKRNQMVSRCPGTGGSCSSWLKLRTKLRLSDHDHHKPPPSPLLGFQKDSSLSPLWERPILMGDKCQLPKFSGLILYDQTGALLSSSLHHHHHIQQEKPATGIRTTLKDLL